MDECNGHDWKGYVVHHYSIQVIMWSWLKGFIRIPDDHLFYNVFIRRRMAEWHSRAPILLLTTSSPSFTTIRLVITTIRLSKWFTNIRLVITTIRLSKWFTTIRLPIAITTTRLAITTIRLAKKGEASLWKGTHFLKCQSSVSLTELVDPPSPRIPLFDQLIEISV